MNNEFPKKLKRLRKQKRITQSELAGHLEVSRSAVANWERGIRQPGLRHVKYIAEYFGIPYEELIK